MVPDVAAIEEASEAVDGEAEAQGRGPQDTHPSLPRPVATAITNTGTKLFIASSPSPVPGSAESLLHNEGQADLAKWKKQN